MPKVDNIMLQTIRRKKGELNLTLNDLARLTSLSRWVISDLINGKRQYISKKTYNHLNDWLYKQL